ncbi:MAG: dTDP-4-dehydrorhamnose 3,5-epimerase [Acetobacteraceae bacterium]
MQIERLSIPEVLLLTPRRFADPRGFVSESFQRRHLAEAGITLDFVQENDSFSRETGTVRGLHAQHEPSVQGKLVRVVKGAIFDVAVDARHGSPTFAHHASAELNWENGRQLWIPLGFLHGFCTLAPDTLVIYKMTTEYDPSAECGALWNDPGLAIPWPIAPEHAVLSDKDRVRPPLAACPAWFTVPKA